MERIPIPIKAKPHDRANTEEKIEQLSIVPPHLLTKWLMDNGFIRFREAKAHEYWQHLRDHRVPWMLGNPEEHPELSRMQHFQPVALYADEAEYTASKEKITILYLRTLSQLKLSFLIKFVFDVCVFYIANPLRCKATRSLMIPTQCSTLASLYVRSALTDL